MRTFARAVATGGDLVLKVEHTCVEAGFEIAMALECAMDLEGDMRCDQHCVESVSGEEGLRHLKGQGNRVCGTMQRQSGG